MLRSVSIENYALIDKLNIEFDKGLSIITGETGAGKSILLGALSLILGQRADTSSLKDKEKSCVVEGIFSIEGYGLEPLFAENDLDYDANSTFRRIINPNGKSRAFINDIPVTLSVLKEITDKLIDIHSQHQNLLIANTGFQLWIVDLLADNTELLKTYKDVYSSYKRTIASLNGLRQQHEQSKADYDYLLFQLNQLEEVKLQENEQGKLEVELKLLTHAEEIKSGYSRAAAILASDEMGVSQLLHETTQTIHRLIPLSPNAEELAKRVESTRIEIQDIANEVERLEEAITFSPERQAAVEERLDTIYSLEQKHRVSSVRELLELRDSLQEKINAIVSFDEQLETLEKEKRQKEEVVCRLANQLTEKRKKVLPEVESRIIEMLRTLGIPNATFKTVYSELDSHTQSGSSSISFLFSANKEVAPQDISRVASGGEMSRLMLSLKSLVAQSGKLPTIIFDEIDTGISGEVADKMGQLISQLAQKNQVINITHLPQVASKGNAHYVVYKEDSASSTRTRIRKLNDEERVMEIAKMLSGSSVTEAAINNARVLLEKL
ncbi:MAG: DNA repair protein RecN [Prevotellaceae bacterium]|jgi:DNA repair protein RecN (Recombination protein N)|nr:DNA repair protein RecN [Prevotellaceae bacterium]